MSKQKDTHWYSTLFSFSKQHGQKINHKIKRKLRDSLEIRESVPVLAEQLKKTYAPGSFFKSTTENKPFFEKD